MPNSYWKSRPAFPAALVAGMLLAAPAGAAPGDKVDVLRDLAGRIGAIIGSASSCKDIAKPRTQMVADKFTAVIKEASNTEAERADLTQMLDRGVMDGRTAVAVGRTDCKLADRQLTDLERSIAGPAAPAMIGPGPGGRRADARTGACRHGAHRRHCADRSRGSRHHQ